MFPVDAPRHDVAKTKGLPEVPAIAHCGSLPALELRLDVLFGQLAAPKRERGPVEGEREETWEGRLAKMFAELHRSAEADRG